LIDFTAYSQKLNTLIDGKIKIFLAIGIKSEYNQFWRVTVARP
jgi:hypothetical protein